MNRKDVIEVLIWVILGAILGVALGIYTSSRVRFETKISTTYNIPATEWKCDINAETKEITCKGVMK